MPKLLREWKKLGTYKISEERLTLHEGTSFDTKLLFKNEKGKKVSWITFSFKGKSAGIGVGKTIEKYRKKGLGKSLIRHSLMHMKEKGVENVFVQVMPVFGDPEKVEKLLKREGFEPAGRMMTGIPVYTLRNLHRKEIKKIPLQEVKK